MLLSRAEIAMYAAKRRNNGPVTYDPAIDATSAQTLTLMSELRQAVDRNELRLYLQPKLALDDRRVVGAEALVRWQHPQRGLVPPVQFIPFAEQTGFIRILTMWVFEEAARHWLALAEEGLQLCLSVNLSTRDLLDLNLPQKFAALLARRLARAGRGVLPGDHRERDHGRRQGALASRWTQAGARWASSCRSTTSARGYLLVARLYLKRLPVDELKDRPVLRGRNMQSDRDDEMIVRSTIDLAHNLGHHGGGRGRGNRRRPGNQPRDLRRDRQAQGTMGRLMPVSELLGLRRRAGEGACAAIASAQRWRGYPLRLSPAPRRRLPELVLQPESKNVLRRAVADADQPGGVELDRAAEGVRLQEDRRPRRVRLLRRGGPMVPRAQRAEALRAELEAVHDHALDLPLVAQLQRLRRGAAQALRE